MENYRINIDIVESQGFNTRKHLELHISSDLNKKAILDKLNGLINKNFDDPIEKNEGLI